MPVAESLPLTVVKVGGSLLDLPDFADRLRQFVERQRSTRLLLVPGGGTAADVVRGWDRLHRLGEDKSHWLALRAAACNAWLLEALLPGSRVVDTPTESPVGVPDILDVFTFARDDERSPGRLPHSWDVTTDAVAARAAIVGRASRLILLKSVDLPAGTDWPTAASRGLVDPVFPGLVKLSGLNVAWVNFRASV